MLQKNGLLLEKLKVAGYNIFYVWEKDFRLQESNGCFWDGSQEL